MNWDSAERELLTLVRDSRTRLLDQHTERSRSELEAAIRLMIHDETELWQRRAAANRVRTGDTAVIGGRRRSAQPGVHVARRRSFCK